MTTTCFVCGKGLPGGTLLTHVKTEHPTPETKIAKPRTCYRKACVEFYGPKGHVPGLEGPHAY